MSTMIPSRGTSIPSSRGNEMIVRDSEDNIALSKCQFSVRQLCEAAHLVRSLGCVDAAIDCLATAAELRDVLNGEAYDTVNDDERFVVTPRYMRILVSNDDNEVHTINLHEQTLLNDDIDNCTFEIPVTDESEFIALGDDFKSIATVQPVLRGVTGEPHSHPGDGLRLNIVNGKITNIDFEQLRRSIQTQIGA